MFTKEWLIDRTRFYQKFKFFEEYVCLSDEELADRMIWLCQKKFGTKDISNYFREGYDFSIIQLDSNRVLCVWCDYLYGSEPSPYNFEWLVETIQNLATISRRGFIPQNIKEVRPGKIEFVLDDNYHYTDEGIPNDPYYIQKTHPGIIEFLLDGENYCLTIAGAPDDPLILCRQINPILLKKGYQFKAVNASPSRYIFMMTAEEMARENCFIFTEP